MKFELTWNPKASTRVSAGYEENDVVSIGVGGVTVVGAYVTITDPDSSLHNWQFGYVQNVLGAKNIWIYRDARPPEKIKKEVFVQCLDQGKQPSGFFYMQPVTTSNMKPHRLSLPEFKDYPRTFGDSSFNRVFGASMYVLWVIAFNTATKEKKVLDHRYWQIFYNVEPHPASEDNVIHSADTGVTFRPDGVIPRPAVKLDGPKANSAPVQRITRFIFEKGDWKEVQESDDSSESSGHGSNGENSDDESSGSLEIEVIDPGKLQVPPGLRGLYGKR